MPSCAHVRISQNSSSVPSPPGSAMNASARSAISALRSCIDPTIRKSGKPVRDLQVDHCLRDHPDDVSTAGQHRVRQHAHQADVSTAIDERHAASRQDASQPARQLGVRRAGAWTRPAEDADAFHSRFTATVFRQQTTARPDLTIG